MARILVIDDDSEMRLMLREMFARQGYDIDTASDGDTGLKLYRENPFDLVITDIIMPNKEGFEMVFELQRDFPDAKVIVISGGGRGKAQDYLESIKKISVVKCTFTKPFGQDEILKVVKKLLTHEKSSTNPSSDS